MPISCENLDFGVFWFDSAGVVSSLPRNRSFPENLVELSSRSVSASPSEPLSSLQGNILPADRDDGELV